jgi:hypothetical protein
MLMMEKIMDIGCKGGTGPARRSVKNDVRNHFVVLDDLAQKFDDYAALPIIPGSC